jgi:hypothetical protein
MEIAKTILQQLGGNRFAVMTGAKNFVGGHRELSFKVGRNAKGVTHVKITLTPDDLYTVEAFKVRGFDSRTVDKREGVYVDDLQRTFTAMTGLDTHL